MNMVVEGPLFCLQCLPLLALQKPMPELRASKTRRSTTARPLLIFVPAGYSFVSIRILFDDDGSVQAGDRVTDRLCLWEVEGFK